MAKKSYKEKMRELRGLVTFDYDLRKPLHYNSINKINKYYASLVLSKGQPYRIYRTNNKKKLEDIKKAAGINLKQFKAVLIPNHDPQNKTIPIYRNGEIVFKSKYFEDTLKYFNHINLATNLEEEFLKVYDRLEGDYFTIKCGEFELGGGAGSIFKMNDAGKFEGLAFVNQLVNQYSNDKADNYYKRWLHGLNERKVLNQEKVRDINLLRGIYRSSTPKQRKNWKQNSGKKKNSNGGL